MHPSHPQCPSWWGHGSALPDRAGWEGVQSEGRNPAFPSLGWTLGVGSPGCRQEQAGLTLPHSPLHNGAALEFPLLGSPTLSITRSLPRSEATPFKPRHIR